VNTLPNETLHLLFPLDGLILGIETLHDAFAFPAFGTNYPAPAFSHKADIRLDPNTYILNVCFRESGHSRYSASGSEQTDPEDGLSAALTRSPGEYRLALNY
jgi:hypothetical protein